MKVDSASLKVNSKDLGLTLSQTHPQWRPCEEVFFSIPENTARKHRLVSTLLILKIADRILFKVFSVSA